MELGKKLLQSSSVQNIDALLFANARTVHHCYAKVEKHRKSGAAEKWSSEKLEKWGRGILEHRCSGAVEQWSSEAVGWWNKEFYLEERFKNIDVNSYLSKESLNINSKND